MKNFSFIWFCVLLVCSSTLHSQECLHGLVYLGEFENHPFKDFEGSLSLEESTLTIYDEGACVWNLEIEKEYSSKSALKSRFRCDINFDDFHENIDIKVSSYSTAQEECMASAAIPDTIHLIQFEDFDRQFTFLHFEPNNIWFSTYQVTNTIYDIWRSTHFVEIIPGGGIDYFEYVVPDSLADCSFNLLQEAEIETITEFALLKSASTAIIVTPAVFEEDFAYYFNEESTCSEAEFGVESIEIEVKPAFEQLIPIPSEFDLVSEQIVHFFEYTGAGYYEREYVSYEHLDFVENVKLVLDELDSSCVKYEFLECSDFSFSGDTTSTAIVLDSVYLPCKEGYRAAGNFCVTDSLDVPAEYTTRQYMVMVTPASAESVMVPPEIITIERQIIINKDELPAGCVSMVQDSIAIETLVSPAFGEEVQVPAEYETVYRYKIKEPPVFEVSACEDDIQSIEIIASDEINIRLGSARFLDYFIDCIHDSVAEKLIEKGYMAEDTEVQSLAYYQAIIDYQIANNLQVGNVDHILLNHLNVAY